MLSQLTHISLASYLRGPPRGFRDSGRRAIYFQGFGEKGHLFSGIWGESIVLGSREQEDEEKHFRELGRKVIFLSGSREQRRPWGSLIYIGKQHSPIAECGIPSGSIMFALRNFIEK